MTPNEPNMSELLRDVRRAIATAKIYELEYQSGRLGEFVRVNLLSRTKAADVLADAALANGLVHEHGDDVIQAIIVRGLAREVPDDHPA